MALTASVQLANGVLMPWLGLGVFRSQKGPEVEQAVDCALKAGYRSIDTASLYRNETGVGRAIIKSGIPREEIFLTTKIWNSDQGYRTTFQALGDSLDKLQTTYIDLYLIHWPKGELSVQTWKAMEELYQQGTIRAIGVSNFMIHHLQHLMDHCRVMPMVNQYEFHPRLQQPELLLYCLDHNIRPEAWRPILEGEVNNIPLLQQLSKKYGKSPVQITLRWEIQKGVVTIPKSVTPERIIHNAQIFDFEINDSDMALIDQLDFKERQGADPDNFDF
ncbi:MAG: aldo/keto reductase [Bacteroidales bacterium]